MLLTVGHRRPWFAGCGSCDGLSRSASPTRGRGGGHPRGWTHEKRVARGVGPRPHVRPIVEIPRDRLGERARVAGLEDERWIIGELGRAPRSLTTTGTPAAIAGDPPRSGLPGCTEAPPREASASRPCRSLSGTYLGMSEMRGSSGTRRAVSPRRRPRASPAECWSTRDASPRRDLNALVLLEPAE